MMFEPAQGQDPNSYPESETPADMDAMEWPPLDEETIAQIADESFLEYDAREADQADRAGSA